MVRLNPKKLFDAVIVGAGVGGMCAATLLAHRGRKVALLEKRPSLGGRFSTINRNGYQCAVGGLAVPVGHNLEQICEATGIPSGVKPSTSVAVWLDGQYFDISRGGTRRIIKEVAEPDEAQRVIKALSEATTGEGPGNDISFKDWLNQYTHNPRIHGLFQATISSLLTVNSHELPAGEYFRLIRVISPLTFGFIEGGTISLWQRMADFIHARGGEIITTATVGEISTEDGEIRDVQFRHNREDHEISTPIVISNLGPSATIEKVGCDYFSPEYVEEIDRRMRPTALLWIHFASEERLFDYSAVSLGCTRRVNMIDAPSFEAEGVAPEGMHLYTVGAAPLNALQVDDVKVEFAAVMQDLERVIPDFDKRCTILSKTCYRGKWPGFRTVPGSHAGHKTPISGLYNVGDAACPSGYAGSMGAAKSAQLVCDDIVLQR